MGKISYIKNNAGNVVYPVTIGDAVAVDGKTLTSALSGKQANIDDLATIRSGAAAGATAVQPAAISDMETKTHASLTYQPKGTYAGTSVATSEANGLMSSTDKSHVDSMWTMLDTDENNTAIDNWNEVKTFLASIDPKDKTLVGMLNSKADNATTLSGYGITDAKIDGGVITLGSNTITPLVATSTLDATKLSGTIPASCYTDTTYDDYAGSTHGLVPAKTSSTASSKKVLAETGAWVSLPTNTDTKVTSAANHYTPTADDSSAKNASGATGTAGTTVLVITGLTMDAKGHVVGIVSGAATDTVDASSLICTSATYGGSAATTSVQTALTNLAAAVSTVNTNSLTAEALTANTTEYSDSKIAAIVNVAAGDTTIQ